MSKAALKLDAPIDINSPRARNTAFLTSERCWAADTSRNCYRVDFPSAMSLDQINSPLFWREVDRKYNLLAGDTLEIVGPSFFATAYVRAYAKGLIADIKILSETHWDDKPTQVVNDDGRSAYYVKFVDSHSRWCVFDCDGNILSAKHFSREIAVSEMQRIIGPVNTQMPIIG